MNKKNNILIFSLLLILFISISAISAADTNIDNTSNNEKLKATTVKDTTAHAKNTANVKDKLKTGNTKRINYLPNSGTFDLDYDLEYKSGDGTINIYNYGSLTINGKGHTIDAKNKIRIFSVGKGATLTLKNVKIKNAKVKSGVGGAILNSGTIKLTGCTFTNCQVTGSKSEGGAISGAGSATIVKCTFDQCSAGDKAGAVRGEKLTIKSCTFKKCSAPNMGGAIFGNKNKILKCNFNGCSAGYGGAIGGTPDRIVDSNFKNCKATKSSNYDGGGACSGDFPKIESCTFTNCKAEKGFGGAIRGTTNTVNCNFIDCVAKQGGAIRGKGDTTGCTFENCKATKDMGGGIFTEKSTIKKCTFTKCSAKTYGGGIYAGKNVKIDKKTKFPKCTAGRKGNGIYGNYRYI